MSVVGIHRHYLTGVQSPLLCSWWARAVPGDRGAETVTVYRIAMNNADDGWLYTRQSWVAEAWRELGFWVETIEGFTPTATTVWA